MIHRGNLDDFERMHEFIEEVGAVEWGIDAPVLTGSFIDHDDLFVSYDQAAPLMAYAFGGGYHGPSDGICLRQTSSYGLSRTAERQNAVLQGSVCWGMRESSP